MTEDTRDHATKGRRKDDGQADLTLRRLLPWASFASVVGGLLVALLSWFGGGWFGPGSRLDAADARMLKHEIQIAADRRYTDTVASEVSALGSLVAATTTKTCLDAEPYKAERLKLATAGVPCDSLYRQRGLRP